MTNSTQDVEEWFQLYEKREEKWRQLFERGKKEFNQGNYALAARFLEGYRKYINSNAFGLERVGTCSEKFKSLPVDQRIAINLDPVAYCYEQLGDKERAYDSILTTIGLLTRQENYSCAGLLYRKIGRLDDAIESYRESVATSRWRGTCVRLNEEKISELEQEIALRDRKIAAQKAQRIKCYAQGGK